MKLQYVEITFRAHDTFLDSPLSGTLKVEILWNQIILKKNIGSNKTRGLKQDSQTLKQNQKHINVNGIVSLLFRADVSKLRLVQMENNIRF